MKSSVCNNFSKVKIVFLLIPMVFLATIVSFLYWNGAFTPERYVEIQKDTFYFLNQNLSKLPYLQHNITQMGDAFVALSTLSILYCYSPKLWENLVWASLFSLFFSRFFKSFFDIPRPASIYDHSTFTIIGEAAVGYSSMPSGHTITIFTTFTIATFFIIRASFVQNIFKWISVLLLAYLFSFSRTAVGAHYPLDVLIGSGLGVFSALIGIISCKHFRFFRWVSDPKFKGFFIILFAGSLVFLLFKIMKEPLVIYFLPLISLVISLYFLIQSYVQKTKI